MIQAKKKEKRKRKQQEFALQFKRMYFGCNFTKNKKKCIKPKFLGVFPDAFCSTEFMKWP